MAVVGSENHTTNGLSVIDARNPVRSWQFPDADPARLVDRGDELTGRAEDDARDERSIAEHYRIGRLCPVPQSGRPVRCYCCRVPGVAAQNDGGHPRRVLQPGKLLASHELPTTDGVVVAGRRQIGTV